MSNDGVTKTTPDFAKNSFKQSRGLLPDQNIGDLRYRLQRRKHNCRNVESGFQNRDDLLAEPALGIWG